MALLATTVLTALLALSQTSAPDVIHLKNGGFMRGTISELVPGSHVVIVLATGESRRVSMAEVDYAGPDSRESSPGDAPRLENPAPAKKSSRVRAKLSSPDEDARFYLVLGKQIGRTTGGYNSVQFETDTYQQLCAAPCEVDLEPGSYELALGIGKDEPVAASEPLAVSGNLSITGDHTSYAGARVGGSVVSGVGAAIGGILMFKGLFREPNEKVNQTELIGGLITLVASGIVGGIVASIDDEAEFEIVE